MSCLRGTTRSTRTIGLRSVDTVYVRIHAFCKHCHSLWAGYGCFLNRNHRFRLQIVLGRINNDADACKYEKLFSTNMVHSYVHDGGSLLYSHMWYIVRGAVVAQWLGCLTQDSTVAGSIPTFVFEA